MLNAELGWRIDSLHYDVPYADTMCPVESSNLMKPLPMLVLTCEMHARQLQMWYLLDMLLVLGHQTRLAQVPQKHQALPRCFRRRCCLCPSTATELVCSVTLQADGVSEPGKVQDWAHGLAAHFLQSMEESQRQLGAKSWDFLASPELLLDLTDALKAAMELAKCQDGTPEHAAGRAQVACLVKRSIR